MESDVITAKTLASANAALVPMMFRAFHVIRGFVAQSKIFDLGANMNIRALNA
jgi:hypothetical protein